MKNHRLEDLISTYDSYSTVDLSCQKLLDSDMAIILKHAVLEKKCEILNLWGNRFTYESIYILSNILNGNQTLIELDLSYNRLSDEGVKIISKVLSLNTCVLKELDLSSNGLTDESAEYLANMLRKNDKLEGLILNKNEIHNEGLILIANALVQDNKTLKYLKLESNPYITRTGVLGVIDLLKNNEFLEEIYVKDCSIFPKDFQMLEQKAFTTGFDIIVSNRTNIL